ncbi:PREDICTED: uncharacterized protein LOC108552981 [Eufriesea mexicana]|uniref:uncharacterized protein LOC108552981 n=1 Tax=Eufriesea mexicana TaxID=516756 RepID=UPI00083C348E|nr:PREDICTED: uncharacterized protein LOC108552981 [Eufriesea mexicana]XP_017763186.1 PREDICTED: uncharacterized protein LOC108552981 [Eufriesea mexicana]XP_017763187.1 PREDICTED: uncharacterized protein LOC108552981 [Eufriesea mexicana]XP_017763188.1 PREDICTED: uncharacterized protein LOC108552981 [Eufriesea mexicana]XP_017763190.1 PREDICTED: uncharacterized protein LOC108552981 [Eufriesea mexicana]XP_017763191.1 PREDICTED: uncharacterized protein LOC108552981 [Eufriesea mexicana]
MWNRKVFIRIIEVILCIACVVALRVTDDESRRVFHYLRSRSREWSLLNNVTWGAIGAALATATCGGYIIITTGLLIAAATGEFNGRKTEIFFLGLGVILFGIVGALSMASIENVPENLIDNAAVFGALCLLTALVFIADLLMSTPKKKEKHDMRELLPDKRAKRQITTTLSTEKESKSPNISTPVVTKKDDSGNVNDGFEKVGERRQKSSAQEQSEDPRKWEQGRSNQKDAYSDEENENFNHIDREPKEYAQNFENGRALRDSQMYRDSEMQKAANRDSYKMDHRMEMPTVMYKVQDIYQRPIDEIDTPRFPVEMNRKNETIFAKIMNPGVKIMKVERDAKEAFEGYRYSDISQYDNVPIRMKGTSPKVHKKNRDVSFNVPPPPKGYGKEMVQRKDEIEILEECFTSLRTASTGTQTPNIRTPSSPTDPGYVRHTANNWPQDTKLKTPGSSPNRTRN